MKIILTGASGTIGGAALQACLAHPSITTIVALSRRELPVQDPKLQVVLHKDFLHYSADVFHHLTGADACIWSLGKPRAGREVHFDYTLAAVEAFLAHLAPAPGADATTPFRFVYLSGAFVERDPSKSLWFLSDGEVEAALVAFEARHAPRWRTVIARPGVVVAPGRGSLVSYLAPGMSIAADALGAALVDAAVHGAAGAAPSLENADLRERGAAVLAGR